MERREVRAAAELRVAGSKTSPRLVGYASVFNSESDGLPFIEIVRPGAFTRTLADNKQDVVALVHHRPEIILGRKGAGTLGLREDSKGLFFEIMLADTQQARDVQVMVDRRDLAHASFAFTLAGSDAERWSERDGQIVRELFQVNLHDVSLTATPAYSSTEAAMRNLQTWRAAERPRLGRARKWLETCL